jgi:hypothetical protein
MVCYWGSNCSLEISRGNRDDKKGDARVEDNLLIESKVISLGHGEEI